MEQAEVSGAEMLVHLSGGTADDLELLARVHGPQVDLAALDETAWRAAGLRPELVERMLEARERGDVARELERAARLAVRLVPHRCDSYPEALRSSPRPPVVLCVQGRWPLQRPGLAVVGSRAATAYGRQSATLLAGTAARAGFSVVSGLARGIDKAALAAALHEEEGWPVAVLGAGLDVVYPPEHAGLQQEIAARGTLISEFPFGTQPTRWTFPRRNRVIAALAVATLVVEAGPRSGALITAAHALEAGRAVWAVPGRIDAFQSRGANKLVFDGAQPVLGPQSLLALLGGETQGSDGTAGGPLSDPLFALLGSTPRTADDLARASALPVQDVRARLVRLQLDGLAVRDPDGRYRRGEGR